MHEGPISRTRFSFQARDAALQGVSGAAKPASFNLDEVMAKLEKSGASAL
jgi:hypothetical protein